MEGCVTRRGGQLYTMVINHTQTRLVNCHTAVQCTALHCLIISITVHDRHRTWYCGDGSGGHIIAAIVTSLPQTARQVAVSTALLRLEQSYQDFVVNVAAILELNCLAV